MNQPKWTPDSWKNFPIVQQPDWPEKEFNEVTDKIHALPPLVFAGEIRKLQEDLAAAERGEKFLLQGGDCAEDFSRCRAVPIRE
ncbi:MAG: 3-deoxy-7-phosphoheptulonate synthase, partial [Lentisphaeraceae bacterium]|nr:3-deoxy-7-phosphoheptulonate synthase [Lentisphaeraceae bacterium]